MAIGVTNKQYYEDIADAIREKNGSNELYKPSEMAQAISDIETGGGGGGDITDPVEYRRINRDKGWCYIPLPSEMKNQDSPYYEANDCIYMLYDARGEMANPAFNLTYTGTPTCTAYKYRAGANYLTPSTQITANRITSFTLDNKTYKFVAKSNHPTTCKMRIDSGKLRFYENNVMVEEVPITTNATPSNADLVNDLTGTTWGLPTTPTLPNVTSANSCEYWINFTSQNQTFNLIQLDSSNIHYINTTSRNDILAYNGSWTTGYNSITFTGGDDAKLSWLVNWVCAGNLITETAETISVTSAWQDAYLVSSASVTLASSGTTNNLTYYYGDSDWGNYDYVLLVIRGTITILSLSMWEIFNDGVTSKSYPSNSSSELIEVSGKCSSCKISINNGSYIYHRLIEYFSFDGTSNGTNMSYMFRFCYSLLAIPELDTNKVTNMSNMFDNCYSLRAIPELDTSNVTNMNNMFSECDSLQTIPQLDTNKVTNMSYMFYACYSLQTIPELDTSNVTNMSYMFRFCYSLRAIPQLDTSNVTNMSNMFDNCYSLRAIPELDTSNVTNMSYMFASCRILQTIPELDTSSVTDNNNIFQNCNTLQKCGIYGSTIGFSLSASTMLPHDELVNILQNLAVVTTAKTLTLGTTNLNKLTNDEKAIATKKGWTLA